MWNLQKTISIIVIACMLIVCPSVYFICQPIEAGAVDKTALNQRLPALDNYISNRDIVQKSLDRIKDLNPGRGPGGNSDDGSEENSGDDQGDGSDSGDDSGGGSDSGGPTVKSSGGGTSDETVTAGAMSEGLILESPTDVVVINEVHPGQGAFDNRDELVELYNIGRSPVNMSLWYIRNKTGQVIGTIPANQILPPRGFLVVEVTGLTEDRQRVALFDSKDKLVDSVTYVGARSHSDLCFARKPDGLNNWEWAASTLGASNQWGNPR